MRASWAYHDNPAYRIRRAMMMIRRSFQTPSLWLAALSCLLAVPAWADPITIDMVTVGNPGNANDTGGTFNGRRLKAA
jgi:hypothetical protein